MGIVAFFAKRAVPGCQGGDGISLCTPAIGKMCFLIHHFLENSADRLPEKEAVVDNGLRFSFSDIEIKANKITNWLLELGICKGDRVGLLLRNSVEYISAYYGILKAGAMAVPFNTDLGFQELEEIMNDCSPRVLITQPELQKKFSKFHENMPKGLLAIGD
ncbi:MAG: AMP-binding protein, partial [Desulfobacterales bacterium]